MSTTGTTAVVRDDRAYDDFLGQVQARFAAVADRPLFTTDAAGLFEAYLDVIPADRQHYTCHACKRFIEGYGGLVTIDEGGRTRSAIWHDEGVPDFCRPVVACLSRIVGHAKVTGVFLSTTKVWGTPVTGPWNHLAVTPPPEALYRGVLLTASQAMAEKKEDYRTVCRYLGEFTLPQLEQVATLLESEALYRNEKVLGPAVWLRDLQRVRDGIRGPARDNVVWRAIATAPAGFCHPRASMIGTLLEDVAAGLDFAEVSRRFAAKMHPLQYQRPTAAPSAGNIAQAEAVVEKLGIARSLLRRFARLDEVEAIWTPAAAKPDGAPAGTGVFAHLTPKGAAATPPALVVPPITMTWDKFSRIVLPDAASIRYLVPPGYGPYAALVTAVDPDAPPILQWDRADRRNPVSWYLWMNGSPSSQWGLVAGDYTKVNAVTFKPARWGDRPDAHSHQGDGVLFVLDGARDQRGATAGAAIFPETLKAELHGVRATIEAYSRNATLEGLEQASACGVLLAKGNGTWNAVFRVTSKGGAQQDYRLDRWD